MYDRIVLGTANWKQEYNGCRVPDDEQERILDWAYGKGIHWLELATAYQTERMRPKGFQLCIKVNRNDYFLYIQEWSKEGHCILSHNALEAESIRCNVNPYWFGVSAYDPEELYIQERIIEIPYSIMDRRWDSYIKSNHVSCFWARSVFLRGRCLTHVSPSDCVKFVLMNPRISKVVIGADSLDQLKESLGWIDEWNQYQCDDRNIIDPRRWT